MVPLKEELPGEGASHLLNSRETVNLLESYRTGRDDAWILCSQAGARPRHLVARLTWGRDTEAVGRLINEWGQLGVGMTTAELPVLRG